ncbi:MAG: flagellar hook-basal body protein, partial [Firmicutes bacterium]|nr:flagellar hook-basal body protein [Bacillota bacterium]
MSVYAALTALNAQQTKLDVIGNNLANVSTVAYKSQSATFSDLLSQTLSSSSAASTTSNTGGTNAKQIGLGVSVAAISTNVTSGSITSTGVDTDVAINGGGYFIVEGDTTGSYYFTRAGNFGVDAEGNLNVNGYKVCGWEPDADQVIDTEAAVSGINLFYNADGSSKQVIAPEKTTTATMDGTLDSTTEAQGDSVFDIGATTDVDADASATISVYDALGNEYDVGVDYTKCYSATVYDKDGTATDLTTVYWEASDSADNVNASGSGYLAFDSTGKLLTGTYYSSNPTVTGATPETYTFAKTYDISMTAATDANGNKLVNIDDFTVSMDVSAVSLYTEGSISV